MPLIWSISAERIFKKKFVNFNVNFFELDVNLAYGIYIYLFIYFLFI